MTEAIVSLAIESLAIERIKDLLIHEAVYLGGVREEVEHIKAELKRMQCFFKDADHKKEPNQVTAIEWQKLEILLTMLKMLSATMD